MGEGNQFRELQAGEKIKGLPRKPWNAMLRRLARDADDAPGGRKLETPVEISVQNKTGSALNRFSIVKAETPVLDYTKTPNDYLIRDLQQAIAPTATATIAITQRPLLADEIGPARILGIARCQVNLTNTAHRYASPTTVTTHLTSGTSGPVKILDTEDHFAAVGTKWAVVLLTGVTSESVGGGSSSSIGDPSGQRLMSGADLGHFLSAPPYTTLTTTLPTIATAGTYVLTIKMAVIGTGFATTMGSWKYADPCIRLSSTTGSHGTDHLLYGPGWHDGSQYSVNPAPNHFHVFSSLGSGWVPNITAGTYPVTKVFANTFHWTIKLVSSSFTPKLEGRNRINAEPTFQYVIPDAQDCWWSLIRLK